MPTPIMLKIYLYNGKFRFVQTDITHKYLGVDRETKKPFAAKKPASREPAYAQFNGAGLDLIRGTSSLFLAPAKKNCDNT